MGAHFSGNDDTVGTEQDIDVAQITTHEHYCKPLHLSNDIALLLLAKPAKLGQGVGLACLPDFKHNLAKNKTCWITGWGHVVFGGGLSNVLREASVPILTPCPAANDETMFCAGLEGGKENICNGDSGGPLVCEFSGKWHLEGVTSWFVGECDPPGGYANVRHFMPWISAKMKSYKNRTSVALNTTSATASLGR